LKNLQAPQPVAEPVDVITGSCEARIVAPHHHERYAIAVATSGAHAMRCRGVTHIVAPGQVIVLGPREIHAATPISEGGWSYTMVYVDERLVRSVAESVSARPLQAMTAREPVVRDRLLRRHVMDVCHIRRQGASLELDERVHEAVAHLVRAYLSPGPVSTRPAREHRAVCEIESYLRHNYASAVRLADLAGLVGLHANYLVGVFALSTGVAPHQYLDQIRVARAQELISQGVSLSEVAASVGYCDQSHLTRQFKRMLGVTPGLYRKTNARRRAS
jgi:AraC-like DNA-binding protein